MKKIFSILLSGSIFFTLFTPNVSATNLSTSTNINESSQSQDSFMTIRDSLSKYHVDESTQNTLITKLENGEVWDSLKENTTPISSKSIIAKDNVAYIVNTYEDGSITATLDYEHPTLRASVSTGEIVSTSGYHTSYKGAQVYNDFIVCEVGFRIDWTWNRYSNNTISSVYRPWALGRYGDATIEDKPTLSNPEICVKAVLSNGVGSNYFYLRVELNPQINAIASSRG